MDLVNSSVGANSGMVDLEPFDEWVGMTCDMIGEENRLIRKMSFTIMRA